MNEIPFDFGEIFKLAIGGSFIIFLSTIYKYAETKEEKKKQGRGEKMMGAFFVTAMIGVFYLFATMKSGDPGYDGIVFPILYSTMALGGLVFLGMTLSEKANRVKIKYYFSMFWKIISK